MDLTLMAEFNPMLPVVGGMPRTQVHRSACVRLPLLGEITTSCLNYMGWYSAQVDLSGIDFLWTVKRLTSEKNARPL